MVGYVITVIITSANNHFFHINIKNIKNNYLVGSA